MRLTLIFALGASACTTTLTSTDAPVLRIEPADALVTVINGKPVIQPLVATLDGVDVTAETQFALADAAYGKLQPAALLLTGERVGVTQVSAVYGDLKATSTVHVYARTLLIEEGVSSDASARFAAVPDDNGCAPEIMYPAANAVVPNNLGLDVAWTESTNRLFEVSFESEFARVDILTSRTSIDAMPDAAWNQLAASDTVHMRIRGLTAMDATAACATTTRTVRVTDQPMLGQVFYAAEGAGIIRQDVSRNPAPQRLEIPASFCRDCAVTRTGSHLAVMLDDGDTAIYDFTSKRVVKPTMKWESVTFTADPTKLVVEQAGKLHLIDDVGNDLAMVPTVSASDPEMSPDDTMLAYVESVGYDYSIVTRSHDSETHAFGEPFVVVAPELGVATLWPTWSADGQWLAYTRVTTDDNGDELSAIWIIRADRRVALQVTAPMREANLVARWAPGAQTVDGEKMFYLTFNANWMHGRNQIWMAAFLPGLHAVRPAVRLPFQSGSTANRVAHWAAPVVLR